MNRFTPLVAMLPCSILPAVLLASCQTGTPAPEPASAPAPRPIAVQAFVQGTCGDCHGVSPNTLSPNPMAPTFPEIVNREGLTRETLTNWLHDAHNYPEEMDFDLDRPRVEELVDYMLPLQDDAYEKPIF